jgi:hypothetical protein
MKKKLFLLICISLILFFSSCDSNRKISIEECKENFVAKLTEFELNKYERINTIGKYGDSYVFACYDEDAITLIEPFQKYYLGGVIIRLHYKTSLIVQHENEIYDADDAYNLGLLLNEDALDLKEKVESLGIDKDYDLVDPNPKLKRCLHHFKKWKVINEPTCIKEGLQESVCKKCKKAKREVMVDKVEHKIVNGICSICSAAEPKEINENKELISLLPSDCEYNFIVGLEDKHPFYGSSSFYFYEVVQNAEPKEIRFENIGGNLFFKTDNVDIYAVNNGELLAFSNSLVRLSNLGYDVLYKKLLENSSVDKIIQENSSKLVLLKSYLFNEKDIMTLNKACYEKNLIFDEIKNVYCQTYNRVYTNYENQQYNQTNNYTPRITNFFGKFDEAYVFYNTGHILDMIECRKRDEVINDLNFKYPQSGNIIVFYKNKIYSLKEAYDKKIISNESLLEIKNLHIY